MARVAVQIYGYHVVRLQGTVGQRLRKQLALASWGLLNYYGVPLDQSLLPRSLHKRLGLHLCQCSDKLAGCLRISRKASPLSSRPSIWLALSTSQCIFFAQIPRSSCPLQTRARTTVNAQDSYFPLSSSPNCERVACFGSLLVLDIRNFRWLPETVAHGPQQRAKS